MLDTNTYRIVNKARQLGFSFTIAAEGLMEALMTPGIIVLYVSTGEKAAKRVLDYCKDIYYSFPRKIQGKTDPNSATEFGFPNKSILISLPNNPSTARGPKARKVYIDEAAHFLNESKIFTALQPTIARGGDFTIISTPNGRGNKFFDVWENNPAYTKHLIDWEACPDEKYKKFVSDMRNNMDELSFLQEYGCSFTEDLLSFFPYNLILQCVNPDLEDVESLRTRNSVYMGVDFAEKRDSTAVVVAERTSNDNIYIRLIKTYEKIPYAAQLEDIFYLCEQMSVGKVNCDGTGVGVKLTEDLQARLGDGMVTGVHFNPTSKECMMKTLRVLLESERIVLPKNDIMINQLRSLERSYTEQGTVRFKHVGQAHDDVAWALALCVKDCASQNIEIAYKANQDVQSISHLGREEKRELRNIVLVS